MLHDVKRFLKIVLRACPTLSIGKPHEFKVVDRSNLLCYLLIAASSFVQF